MSNDANCKHYDKENGWCKKLSDWSDPMPHIVYCPKSPCEYAEPIKQPMTDNDIIKALECCAEEPMLNCRKCPYEKSCNMGRSDMQKDALDLITRQKAEIERLQEYYKLYFERERAIEELNTQIEHLGGNLKFVRGTAERQLAEIERLRKTLGSVQHEQYTNGRNDGIREFAAYLCDGRVSNDPVVIAVKCAVKEMTEGEDESVVG